MGDSGGLGIVGRAADIAEEDGRGLADAALRGFVFMADVANLVAFHYHTPLDMRVLD